MQSIPPVVERTQAEWIREQTLAAIDQAFHVKIAQLFGNLFDRELDHCRQRSVPRQMPNADEFARSFEVAQQFWLDARSRIVRASQENDAVH